LAKADLDLDGREEANPVPIATRRVADVDDQARRGGRLGAPTPRRGPPE